MEVKSIVFSAGDPVNASDPSGQSIWGAALGAVAGCAIGAVVADIPGCIAGGAAGGYLGSKLGNGSHSQHKQPVPSLPTPSHTTPCTTSPTTSTVPGPTSPTQTAYEYFVQKGLLNYESAAIVGNLLQESQLDPTIGQYPAGPGRGIAQWEVGGRWNQLVAFASTEGLPWTNFTVQLDFIWHELNSDYSSALTALTDSYTYIDATILFEDSYEGASDPKMTNRVAYAKQVMMLYGGGVSG